MSMGFFQQTRWVWVVAGMLVCACAPDAEEHSRKGESYVMVKNYAAAINEFKMSSEKDPTQPMTFYHLGFCQMNIGKFEEAVDAFHHCLDLDPLNVRVYINLAVCHEYLDNSEAARQALMTALDLQPTSLRAHFNLASLYLRRGNLELAERHLKNAERLGLNDTGDLRKMIADSLAARAQKSGK